MERVSHVADGSKGRGDATGNATHRPRNKPRYPASSGTYNHSRNRQHGAGTRVPHLPNTWYHSNTLAVTWPTCQARTVKYAVHSADGDTPGARAKGKNKA